MERLSDRNLLPEHLGEGTTAGNNVNPWGGNYYISASITIPLNIRVIVGLTQVPVDAANSLTEIVGTGTACSTTGGAPGPVSTTCPSTGPTGTFPSLTAGTAIGTGYAILPTGWGTDETVTWAHSFR